MSSWDGSIPWSDVPGIVGVFIYICSYFGLQAGLIKGQGYLYPSLITVAACCVLLSLVENFNLSAATIQICYIAISVFGMVRFFILTQSIKFTDDERILLDEVAPNLHKVQARRLLRLGTWSTALPETRLTEEGAALSHLYFLLEGAADVRVAGGTVAQLGPRSLIGEMSCLTGMPVSASVTITEPSRVFAVEVPKLNLFLARNLAVRQELEGRFAYQVSKKLIRANASLSGLRAGGSEGPQPPLAPGPSA